MHTFVRSCLLTAALGLACPAALLAEPGAAPATTAPAPDPLQTAAVQDDAEAQYALARRYAEGQGVPQD